MTEKKLVVASSPHFRAHATVQTIMGDVLIALAPALAAALYFFGFKAFTVIAVCVLASVVSEAAWQKLMGHPQTIKDLSAVVTGLLLAFNLPPTVPLWLAAFGSIFAIIVVKHFFGGIGQNIVNPALAARAMLLASWPVAMTTWAVDGMTTATPLALLKEGTVAILPTLSDVFIGHVGGCLGETSALALLLGGAYLLWRKVISWHIPVIYISTVFVLTALLGREGWMTGNPLYEIFLGGLMVGAFFMATDYTTSPMTKKGQVIFASGCGILTTLIRLYGGYAEGVSYSILIMNLFVPLIDRVTVPRIFGEVR
ncbi:MAG: RnfABCDGE type electron transport complex subunit D [Aminobacterium colombiense]|jgi:electron transport complex protein RnfD|uniref:RnfABCDGE type electron transport complex subunit D n=3 Tax=Aminobacteriaceae TaxID=3029087 RepID=UPI000AFDA687|nr:RnfABCDGE type electron transport complex subunit D [Aminobacterium sp. EBM-42]MDD2379147.1 RnfABCDGE type electron transport complex subunit D [Aminobacterium colombiense]MDD3767883.1 RnfABCDGE type electron transport complex subunit D [Aminobacterium colombiense]MDD4265692.1 RnfABCDGE type electron transport complex subunit D [Aminobacterium colombiense]MDD4586450.1 RnfABCDGE type electron transport complex subunit D [Aminobacterium colombiense]NLK30665.1 RnfABCDGE type electron transport